MEHVIIAHDALIDRADRAIADAVTICAEVRAGQIAARRRHIFRPPDGAVPSEPLFPPPLIPEGFLEPWLSVARSLPRADLVGATMDSELERAWRRALPLIETPSAILQR